MTNSSFLSGTTRVVGVIGDPVAHSLSPGMHNAAYAAQGLDQVYVAFHVLPERLEQAVQGIRALGLAGVNVTIPHKQNIIPFLDELATSARLIGAVNTVVNRNGILIGHNTDGAGFLESLRTEAGFTPEKCRVLILGAGGAARAIGVQLALSGAARVDIANRTVERAAKLAGFLSAELNVASAAYGLASLTPALTEPYDLLVQTTSWGMAPHDDVPPLLDPEALHPHALIADIVYTPQETSLLRAARERGCRTLEGLGMLVHQAALAHELWTGQKAPVAVMYTALKEQLARRR